MAAIVVVVVAIAVAALVAIAWGWKFVAAPLIGALVWAWGTATLRSFRRGAHGVGTADEGDVSADAVPGTTLFWCEECGAELLVVAPGSGLPPRHCGARMHARTEI